jgi:hypothetical protein
MKQPVSSFFLRSAPSLATGVVTHLLVAYFYVGTCGDARSGFVLALRVGKVAATAAWCAPPPPPPST